MATTRTYKDLRLEHETLIEQHILDCYEVEGYTLEVDGEQVIEPPLFHKAIFKVVVKVRPTTAKERDEKAITAGRIASTVFPSAPGADGNLSDLSDDEMEVWETLISRCRSKATQARSGPVQKLVGGLHEGLLLVNTKVAVDGRPNAEWACYVTDNMALVAEDYESAYRDTLHRAAVKYAKNLSLVGERRPDEADRIRTEVSNGMKAAAGLARNTLALTMGDTKKKDGAAAKKS